MTTIFIFLLPFVHPITSSTHLSLTNRYFCVFIKCRYLYLRHFRIKKSIFLDLILLWFILIILATGYVDHFLDKATFIVAIFFSLIFEHFNSLTHIFEMNLDRNCFVAINKMRANYNKCVPFVTK